MTYTLSPALRRMLNERVDILRRAGDDDPSEIVLDEHGNAADPWEPIENTSADCPYGDGKWAAGIELTRDVGAEETGEGRDVGTTAFQVFLEPDAPISRIRRIRRADGTILSPRAGALLTDPRGHAHHEYRAVEIT